MKAWISFLIVWYALLVGGWFVVTDRHTGKPAQEPDWEGAALCLIERYDPADSHMKLGRQIRFCVTFGGVL